MADNTTSVGKPMDRVDGRLKVTGAREIRVRVSTTANLAHAVMIVSTVPCATISVDGHGRGRAVAGRH